MSYHYPSPNPHPGLDSSPHLTSAYQLPALVPQSRSPSSPTLEVPVRNRGTVMASKSGKVKRSLSTPNVRGQASSDAAALALSAEKRRNKLGYHRTSVACGHCRRRKIRCIPAQGDLQNRCSNCIRLKKECIFFPVDQPPQLESRNARDPIIQEVMGSGSQSSSPTSLTVAPHDLQDGVPYTHLTMPPIQDPGNSDLKKPRMDSFSPENKAHMYSRPQEYGHNTGPWIASEASAIPRAPTDVSPTYWRETPSITAFAPYPSNPQISHQSNWPPSGTDSNTRDELGWHIPQRSISYGNLEGLPHQSSYSNFQHTPSHTNGREDFTHRSNPQRHETYIPALTPSSGSMPASATSSTVASVDHTINPSEPQPPSFSQGWQNYGYPKAPVAAGGEGYAGWYSPGPNVPSHSHGGPAGIVHSSYSPAEQYPQVYYPPVTTQGRR
jgi:hypothetical protein